MRQSLLDAYEAERIGFARRLVATTDRAFTFATAEGRIAEILRTRSVPVIFPRVAAFGPIRDYIFRTVSQIALNYRSSRRLRRSRARRRSAPVGAWASARTISVLLDNHMAGTRLWHGKAAARRHSAPIAALTRTRLHGQNGMRRRALHTTHSIS